jgi:hypothetical protein
MSQRARVFEPVAAPEPEPPPVTASRRGLRLRHVKGAAKSFYEVECPGELERLKDRLASPEFEAGLTLRRLWVAGTMNPETQSSCLDRLGMPPSGFHDVADERRLEAQDRLRAAVRAMGYMGMGGRLAVEVVAYERRVRNAEELLYLRDALSRLADHLWQARTAAA